MNRLVTIFVAGFIALMLLSSTVFVVDQKQLRHRLRARRSA